MAANRTLTLEIFRYNPQIPEIKPRTQKYQIEEQPMMTLFLALNQIREQQDRTLIFDFVCRAAICGSCAMFVNGKPKLACKTLTKDLPEHITLYPLPFFKLIGDLSVDTGNWFRHMNMRTEGWIHPKGEFNPNLEERMSNDTASKIFEAERCIECGCCIAACGTANMRPDFIGAAGINRMARFLLDPRDNRTTNQYFDIMVSEDGSFGCMGLIACDDYCPQEISLQMHLAFVRRKIAGSLFYSSNCRMSRFSEFLTIDI